MTKIEPTHTPGPRSHCMSCGSKMLVLHGPEAAALELNRRIGGPGEDMRRVGATGDKGRWRDVEFSLRRIDGV